MRTFYNFVQRIIIINVILYYLIFFKNFCSSFRFVHLEDLDLDLDLEGQLFNQFPNY